MADAKPSTPTPEETIARAVSHAGPDALRDITPLVMGIGVSSGFDLEDPLTLLQPIARVTPKVHPLLDALLSLAGARKMGTRSYAFATGRGSDPEGLVMFLNALPAGMVRQHGMVWDYPSHSFRYDDSPGYKLTYLRTGGYHRTLPSSWMSDAALDAAMMSLTPMEPFLACV
jgi:hypothetical protein